MNRNKLWVFTYMLLGVVLFSSCAQQASRMVCNCEQQKQLQTFVTESIKPANNMSDEEMEDVIHQLRIDGVKMFCQQKPVWITSSGEVDWRKEKVDSCSSIMLW